MKDGRKMIFSEKYHSRIEDFGRGGLMTPEAVLRVFENTGSHHSDSVGDSLISGSAAGIAWIVAEWNVKIHRAPKYGEELIQSTCAVGLKPAIQNSRKMAIKTASGEVCAEGSAKLVRLDVATGKPVKSTEELIARYAPEPENENEQKLPRLVVPKEFDCEQEVLLRRGDIDYNGHVHNANYLTLAIEALPEALYREKKIVSYRISYRLPIKESDKVTVRIAVGENSVTECFFGSDGTLKTIVFFEFDRTFLPEEK